MHRSLHILALAALGSTLVGCYGPEPRPFAGRGGRSLEQPPRYGETNRYVQPTPRSSPQMSVDPDIDPRTVPPGADLRPPTNLPPIDPGLSTAPPSNTPAPSTTPPPSESTTDTTAEAAPKPPASSDAPYARAVPGKPGFVYSPHESGKILDVTGLRPGTKVKDPQTGAMFRVP